MSQAPKVDKSQQQANTAADKTIDKRLNKRLKDMPIAIVGMASIFANSRYLNKFWDLISEKIDAITDIPASHWNKEDYFDKDKTAADKIYCQRGGFLPEVDFNPMEFGLPPNILELTDTSQLLSLVVAKEVLADAGITDSYDTDRIGITLGVGGGQKINHSLSARLQYPVLKKVLANSGLSDADTEMVIKKFQDQYIHWEENSFPGSLGNVIAGRIANRFDFGGMNCVVDAACAGSLAAMRMALTELVEGRSDVMITGGVCTDNSPSMYMSFSKTPAFTTNDTIQPFDIDSKGMMIGEGIGMVALKRLDEAERDGDRIYAVIKGVGSSSDGKFKSIYAPRPEGQAKALKRAYDDAGFAPHTIGLMEAHGTGTAAGDVAEFNGLKSVFSEGNDTQQHIALGSIKSQIGHTKSTAGTAGVIKAALALHHKVLPPTINVSKPNPKLDVQHSPFYLNTETRPWMARPDGTPRRAGISSFGFGGTNFHLVLEEYNPEHARGEKYRYRAVPQSLLISGADKAALIAEINAIVAQVSTLDSNTVNLSEITLRDLASRFAVRQLDDNHPRVGLVVSNLTELQTQLNQVLAQLASQQADNWQLPSGTRYRANALVHNKNNTAKVAALFAGQGSQYLNMGLDLACYYPEMRTQVALADKVFASHNQTPLSQILFPIPAFEAEDIAAQQALLTNTANAQSAIGAVSMGQYQLLTQAGFNADMVAGHSFGELSALFAAGVISNEDYYQLAFARGQAMAATPKDQDAGAMYAVIISNASDDAVAKIEAEISQFAGVKVANYNSPSQLVIAGPTDSSAQAAKAIQTMGFKAIALPVSGAFHTPLVAHAQKPFSDAINKVKFAKPAIALYANATGKLHAQDAKTIQKDFSQHMLQSVRFSDQLTAMYAAGARVFVEFGPKNILQKLVEDTLTAHKDDISVISLNPNPKGDSDLQLRQAAMQLAVIGVNLSDIDPYQAPIAPLAKASPMNVKLTANNFISAATRNKMQTSLTTGAITPARVEVPVEKIVEKIVEKEVIKTEYIEVPAADKAPASHATTSLNTHDSNMATAASVNTSAAFNQSEPSSDSLTAFFNAQQQAANLHQQFLAIPQQYGDTFTHLMVEQSKMAAAGIAIPQSLQRSIELFHQHQAQTLQSHTLFLEQQAKASQSALAMLTGQTPAVVSAPVLATQAALAQVVQAAPVVPAAPSISPVQAASVQAAQAQPTQVQAIHPVQQAAVAPSVVTPVAITPALVEAPTLSADKVLNTMLEVVAEKTGYPTEMLELSMDMEADLGIDSIKRVEILGTVQDELPSLPELSPEDLAECRTLGEIVDYMNSKLPTDTAAPAPAPAAVAQAVQAPVIQAAASGLSAETVLNTMLAVVADKTGYPTEMLELSMDMEADLGIDSIKRVEILGTVQDELPSLPELSPEDLAECRTLGEIVDYMNSKLPADTPAPVAQTPVVQTASALSAETVLNTMLAVVADKTGYPAEMLELSMDMEADLGIDSIKRVEILGTVQDELPSLPELSPEDLAECRTLGEIVDYMNSKQPADTPAPVAQASVAQTPVVQADATSAQSSAVGLNAQQVQNTMMSVVADKTGYPAEMLELSMDMEADLGIDSIKRVEILGTVQDELPSLPELSPEDLAECRTLGEIVDYMNSKLPADSAAPAPVALEQVAQAPVAQADATSAQSSAVGLNAQQVQNTMMSVVADKTGYPAEMLELSMDMEADLGIDSIKRVEILGTVQDELPSLPELSPEDLAECRTLGEIVAYMNSKLTRITTAESSLDQNLDSAATEQASASKAIANDLPPHSEVALKKLSAADKLVDCYAKQACIVINDDGHNAGVLAEKLIAAGLTVAVIRSPKSITVSHSPLSSAVKSFSLTEVSDEAIKAVIDQISQHHHIAGFVHLQPQITGKGTLPISSASFNAVEQAFLMAKHLQKCLTERAKTERVSFMTVSRIDGGFGYLNSEQLAKTELNQAALSGLSKTLSHEWPQVFCRALDIAPSLTAVELAEAITAELFDLNGNTAAQKIVEVGISEQGRHTLAATDTASRQFQAAKLNNDDVILVTGGAKGVTFECALTLAKQTKSHFILAGRSEHLATKMPAWAKGKQASELKAAAIGFIQSQGNKPTPKQIDALVWPVSSSLEIDRALAAFADVGASAQYISMDVSAADSIKQTLAQLAPITGIIHGAGVLADKHIQDKTLAELTRVYGTKVTGFANIINAIDASQLKLVAMFSSAAGFYGNTGQSDYAMSNEILNKTALQLANNYPQAKVMSFNWGPWNGGMVSSALKKMFVERGVYVIPLDKGAKLFAHSLLSDSGVQLLIGSDMQGASNNADNVSPAVKKPNASSLHNAKGSLTLSFNNTASHAKVASNSQKVVRVLNPLTMPFIQDHCIAGNPVLPTVCAIAWMRETAQQLCGLPVSVSQYKLLKGIIFDSAQPHLMQLELTETDKGLTALISSRLLRDTKATLRPQYQADLIINQAALNVENQVKPSLPAEVVQYQQAAPLLTKAELYSNGCLFHGPRLQGIKQVLLANDNQLICQVALPHIKPQDCSDFAAQLALGGSQIFAEDLLLQAMLVWARVKYDAASLPSTIGEMTTLVPFKANDCGYILLDVVKHSGRALTANISLYHEDGRLSCTMTNAKTTISKSLNEAFLAPAKALADLQESV
ncbi:type I polyketide synthase [Shewanella aestuarii]|uniref:Acyltransferase domain-containing protein n=1 Tax=Shewanella aestuarii TaxID=1028752 RepID=A0A6G9QI67_9GAMM|nr:type I polyketide synthase [Shewanella aestuarii]QIR14098.1 acyltransferase domain-containing protein [Shewanella aestuarii]